MEFTVYWKQLTNEIIEITHELLEDQTIHIVLHENLDDVLKAAHQISEVIASLPSDISSAPISIDVAEFSILATRLHVLYRGAWMLTPEQRIKFETIDKNRLALGRMIPNLFRYNAQLLKKPDLYHLKDVDLYHFLELFSSMISHSRIKNISVSSVFQDYPLSVVIDTSIDFRLYDVCRVLSNQDSTVQLDISASKQDRHVILLFIFSNVSTSAQQISDLLNPQYAVQNNELELLILKDFVEGQEGRFEIQLDSPRLTIKIALPLSDSVEYRLVTRDEIDEKFRPVEDRIEDLLHSDDPAINTSIEKVESAQQDLRLWKDRLLGTIEQLCKLKKNTEIPLSQDYLRGRAINLVYWVYRRIECVYPRDERRQAVIDSLEELFLDFGLNQPYPFEEVTW